MKRFNRILRIGAIAFSVVLVLSLASYLMESRSEEEKAYADSLRRPAEAESLLAWTPDTILKTNPELVMLFDTLYQYAGNNSVPTSTVWLQRYREKLCTYYNKHHLGSDTISFYAKAAFRCRSYYLQIQVADNQCKCLCFRVTKVTSRDSGVTQNRQKSANMTAVKKRKCKHLQNGFSSSLHVYTF